MFRLIESSSDPQDVDPSIQPFTALWDPQRLQSKKYALYIKIKYQCLWLVWYNRTEIVKFVYLKGVIY